MSRLFDTGMYGAHRAEMDAMARRRRRQFRIGAACFLLFWALVIAVLAFLIGSAS